MIVGKWLRFLFWFISFEIRGVVLGLVWFLLLMIEFILVYILWNFEVVICFLCNLNYRGLLVCFFVFCLMVVCVFFVKVRDFINLWISLVLFMLLCFVVYIFFLFIRFLNFLVFVELFFILDFNDLNIIVDFFIVVKDLRNCFFLLLCINLCGFL